MVSDIKHISVLLLTMLITLRFYPCMNDHFGFLFIMVLEYNVAVFVTNQMTADPGAGMR